MIMVRKGLIKEVTFEVDLKDQRIWVVQTQISRKMNKVGLVGATAPGLDSGAVGA